MSDSCERFRVALATGERPPGCDRHLAGCDACRRERRYGWEQDRALSVPDESAPQLPTFGVAARTR